MFGLLVLYIRTRENFHYTQPALIASSVGICLLLVNGVVFLTLLQLFSGKWDEIHGVAYFHLALFAILLFQGVLWIYSLRNRRLASLDGLNWRQRLSDLAVKHGWEELFITPIGYLKEQCFQASSM